MCSKTILKNQRQCNGWNLTFTVKSSCIKIHLTTTAEKLSTLKRNRHLSSFLEIKQRILKTQHNETT